MQELGVQSEAQLLPLLAGVLLGGAGGVAAAEGDSVAEAQEQWRRVRCAAFSEDAALVLQQRVLEGCSGAAFREELGQLRAQWREHPMDAPDREERRDIQERLCMARVLAPLMLQFGFKPDASGMVAMEDAVAAFATINDVIAEQAEKLEEALAEIMSGF